ncbi:hypothetical protein PENVUL_c001G05108 [Penicillium vulpinum]|uniref:Amino acid permease/ SLC12A domain-containing protein n=1 Tax=Penicillium vulpinum TaxID=29845 RepID=A0A1V6SDM2_9EURO|nr:hypothetical protein PENVUL_c001G05108 [Penicillium vulpinum]
MASTQYNELFQEIYVKIMERMEMGHEEADSPRKTPLYNKSNLCLNPGALKATKGGEVFQEKRLAVTLGREWTVSRALRGIRLFMIAVNATLGTGLYWRGGQIFELGEPLAVCLFDILLYIGGNLRRGVQFLGLHPHQRSYTGRAYISNHSTGTRLRQFDKDQSMLYPSLLINANVFDLGAKRVNLGAGPNNTPALGIKYWALPIEFDTRGTNNWGTGLLMSISIAIFAYTGVEVIAASALEAKWPHRADETPTSSAMLRRSNGAQMGKSFKLPLYSFLYLQ